MSSPAVSANTDMPTERGPGPRVACEMRTVPPIEMLDRIAIRKNTISSETPTPASAADPTRAIISVSIIPTADWSRFSPMIGIARPSTRRWFIGGTSTTGEPIGAGTHDRANTLARQTVLWGFLLSIPLGIVGYAFAPNLIQLFHTETDVEQHAITYLQITGGLIVTLLMTFVCGAVLRGAGDGRSPLIYGASAMWLAVLLSWVLVNFFDGQLWWVRATFFVTTPIPAAMNWITFRKRMRHAEHDLLASSTVSRHV